MGDVTAPPPWTVIPKYKHYLPRTSYAVIAFTDKVGWEGGGSKHRLDTFTLLYVHNSSNNCWMNRTGLIFVIACSQQFSISQNTSKNLFQQHVRELFSYSDPGPEISSTRVIGELAPGNSGETNTHAVMDKFRNEQFQYFIHRLSSDNDQIKLIP